MGGLSLKQAKEHYKCNCCRTSMGEMKDSLYRSTSKEVLPLFYRSPRGLLLCSRCASSKGWATSGSAVIVFKCDTKKFSMALDIDKWYKPNLVVDAEGGEDTFIDKINRAIKETKTEKVEKATQQVNVSEPSEIIMAIGSINSDVNGLAHSNTKLVAEREEEFI